MVMIKPFNALTSLELYDIMNLRLTVFVEEQKIMYVDTDYDDIKADHAFYIKDHRIVSYARILKKDQRYEGYMSIGRVATHKDARQQGYASAILKEILASYQASFIISAQAYLTNYYEKFGFKVISKPYIEEGILHVKMLYESKI
jgi:ElaA protein